MSEFNIEVEGGSSVRLPTAGKYCDRNIVVTATGGGTGASDTPVYKTINDMPYRRVFHDDFDSGDINHNYWTEDYHPSRANPAYFAYSDVRQENGNLVCRVKPTQPARKGTSTYWAASGIMSGKWNGMHLSDTIYHDFRPWYGLISQEGYYEARIKIPSGSTTYGQSHCAWWMVGTENTGTECAEWDVVETLNGDRVLPHNLHPWNDTSLEKLAYAGDLGKTITDEYHTIGFLWENGKAVWYLDGEVYDTKENIKTPQYPMITYFTLYRNNVDFTWDYDAEFCVDYFSIYKKADTRQETQPTIVDYSPKTLDVEGYMVDANTGKLLAMPLYCYLYWSDGTRTEHWVKWDIFDDAKKAVLDENGTVVWKGIVYDVGKEITCDITNIGSSSDSFTWLSGKAYASQTGELVDADNQMCTEKFTLDNLNYKIVRNYDTVGYTTLHAWDENGNYLGYERYSTMNTTGDMFMVANPNYSYALRIDAAKMTNEQFDNPVSIVSVNTGDKPYGVYTLADLPWEYDSGYKRVKTKLFQTSATSLDAVFNNSNILLIGKTGANNIINKDARMFEYDIQGGYVYLYSRFETVDGAIDHFTTNDIVLEINKA